MTDTQKGIKRRTLLVASGVATAATVLRPLVETDAAARAQSVEMPTVPRGALWYDRPGINWESEALPIGNGRLGAMLFGGIPRDRIHLNEQSMWGGLNNFDGAYDLGVTAFGSFRNFGDLEVFFDGMPVKETSVTTPGGPYNSPANQTVAQSHDENISTKWCIENPPSQVQWQVNLATPTVVTSYTLTSAEDVPQRDPQSWRFEGSTNGTSWQTLDTKQQPPFENRRQAKTFTVTNAIAYSYYRFVFIPVSGVSHFQVAEIALAGIKLGSSVINVTAPGGPYSSPNHQSVAQSCDGNINTKWCIEFPPSQVLWQAGLPSPRIVSSYSLTSAEDVPQRDPQNWRFEGSMNGLAWTTLDTRNEPAPFENRRQTKTFISGNTQAFRYYRFVFLPIAGVRHFQVAEIALGGVNFTDSVVTNYQRSLDPMTGLHTTSFGTPGNNVVREAFASYDADILVLRYRTDKTSGLSGKMVLTSGQNADPQEASTTSVVSASGDRLSFANKMRNELRYAADVRILKVGGTLQKDGEHVRFSGCTELELRIDLRTDYKMSAGDGWRNGKAPLVSSDETLTAAADRTFQNLRNAHVTAFGAKMNRASINTGRTDDAVVAMPMNMRLARFKDGVSADPELEQIRFQHGRYLLLSSSRPGGLPANLQGLWNDSNQPAWASDYHFDINIQMNYWAAETTGLSETHLPLTDFIEQAAVPLRAATRARYGSNVRGWTSRYSVSIFGGNGWEWFTGASAWYLQHIYEHWAFTRDSTYLERAYPLIKEVCQFWQDVLVERTVDGQQKLVVTNEWSPEHGPHGLEGVKFYQQIVWDIFTNYLEMEDALGRDPNFRATVADLRGRLAPNKIGSWGQLQEWQEDWDVQLPANNSRGIDALHRHTSHLFAVYPGRQITVSDTPAFAAAALKSLNARCNTPNGETLGVDTMRGDSRTSWTWTWRTGLFARLREADRAYAMLRGGFRHNTLDNMFNFHPPFQIDGNLGMSGAMVEMLLQSHDGKIRLLPACPTAWKAQGSFQGLRARGGYKVNASWTNGQVTSYDIIADGAPNLNAVTVVVNGQSQSVTPTQS